MSRYVAAIDQGTTSSRCIVFDHAGAIVAVDQQEHRQIFPRPGLGRARRRGDLGQRRRRWSHGALAKAGIGAADLAAVGITNQRETTRALGQGAPASRSPTPSSGRTPAPTGWSRELGGDGGPGPLPRRVRAAAGHLLLRPEDPLAARRRRRRLRARAERGELLFGTMDTWLIWNLTGRHVTDVTNASRTMLMNLTTLDWDDDAAGRRSACRAPCCRRSAPRRRSTAQARGVLDGRAGRRRRWATSRRRCSARPASRRARPSAPTAPAASCWSTPARRPSPSKHGLLTTRRLPDRRRSRPVYALEGSIAVTGSLVQWLRDNLGLIVGAGEIEALARSVDGQRRLLLRAGLLRPLRAALALRRARRDRRPDRLRHQGPHRPRGAGGDRLADPRGRRRHGRRLRRRR